MVYCGYVIIHSSNCTQISTSCIGHSSHDPTTVSYTNYRRIKISGYVWVDQSTNKSTTGDGGYNSLYDGGETLVNGVTVSLYKKGSSEAVATYITGSDSALDDGEYEFNLLSYDVSILYKDVKNGEYYIEFDYGSASGLINTTNSTTGKDYIPVAFNDEDSAEIVTNGSRALMDDVAEYNDDLSGIATTYSGTDKAGEKSYGLSHFFDTLYEKDSNTLEYINLGIKAYNPDYAIVENLMYVKIEINGYSYLYEYGYTKAVTDNDPFNVTVPTVSFRN